MLNEFNKIIDSCIKYKIDYKNFVKLQKTALSNLGLTSMNKLRDRYEGQAYLDNFLIKSYAELALQNALGITFIEDDKKHLLKTYKPAFEIKGTKTELIYSSVNEYPLVPKCDFPLAAFVFVNLTTRETFFAGTLKKEILISIIDDTSLSPLISRNYLGYLKNLDVIQSFNDKLTDQPDYKEKSR